MAGDQETFPSRERFIGVWNDLPRDVPGAPSLELLQMRMGKAVEKSPPPASPSFRSGISHPTQSRTRPFSLSLSIRPYLSQAKLFSCSSGRSQPSPGLATASPWPLPSPTCLKPKEAQGKPRFPSSRKHFHAEMGLCSPRVPWALQAPKALSLRQLPRGALKGEEIPTEVQRDPSLSLPYFLPQLTASSAGQAHIPWGTSSTKSGMPAAETRDVGLKGAQGPQHPSGLHRKGGS